MYHEENKVEMKDNKLVSIIIPNYNNGEYITQCVESIKMQTYHPIEIVIVDDDSTDGSRNTIFRLTERYDNIVTVFLEENGGVSNARNVGAEFSKGEYLCFLDPDDFFYAKDKIENEMALIQRFLTKGKRVMAFSGVACVNEDGEYVENRGITRMLEGHIVVPHLARYKDDKHPRNELFDREVFMKSGGFDTSMSFWEDDDLFIRILFEREIYFTGKIGTAYRWKKTGLSHQTIELEERVIRQIQKKYYSWLSLGEKIQFRVFRLCKFIYNTRKYRIPQIKHQISIIKHRVLH